MTDLDPYFTKSEVLKASDLAAANDVWRYDGKKQGAGPRYGMARDYSQDSMFWYRSDMFEEAGLDLPSETEPLSCDEWLDLGEQLTRRRLGKVKVYGLDATGMGVFSQLMWMTASAGGSLFADDMATVDFSSPRRARPFSGSSTTRRPTSARTWSTPTPTAGTDPPTRRTGWR